MARSRVTSISTLVMIPRSEPSDSTESSSERSHRSRDGGSAPATLTIILTTRSVRLTLSAQTALAGYQDRRLRGATQVRERRERDKPDGQRIRGFYRLFADQAVERVALGLAAELPYCLGVRGFFVEAVGLG